MYLLNLDLSEFCLAIKLHNTVIMLILLDVRCVL